MTIVELTDGSILTTTWLPNSLPQSGDILTVEGIYKRRTFWQWLFRRPKKPQTFTVV